MRKVHMSVSVRGVLSLSNSEIENQWLNVITVDDKPLVTVQEVRNFFFDQLSQGHEVAPFGDCDNFD